MKNQDNKSLVTDDKCVNEFNVLRDESQGLILLGQWYWVKDKNIKGEEYTWFGCATFIGSNYAELSEPWDIGRKSSTRIHFDEAFERLTFEPNSQSVIRSRIEKYQENSHQLMTQINELTQLLGVMPILKISNQDVPRRAETGTSLASISHATDIKAYKDALVEAKNATLPDLFGKLKESNEKMATWMTAEILPLSVSITELSETKQYIENKVFNISLYAGLLEDVTVCAKGESADILEKLHIMQRMHYMDEECLLNYSTGGMEFKDIAEFGAWLARPDNRDRILPFPKCMIAMRVRRKIKNRPDLSSFVRMSLDYSDKFTYLYIRNGENLYCLSTEIDFSEKIFPDAGAFYDNEPLMASHRFGSCERVGAFMTRSQYDFECSEKDRLEKVRDEVFEQWKLDNPDKSKHEFYYRDPAYHSSFNRNDWFPFDSTSVYFDECVKKMKDMADEYNRIAMIIQGVFDRSEILHPHFKAELWHKDGFDKAVKLVFDHDYALTFGDKPDFVAYQTHLNESITQESYFVGQFRYWTEVEAEKENKRQENDYRIKYENKSNYETFVPYGNSGPELVTQAEKVSLKAGKATFKWQRERLTYDRWDRNPAPVNCILQVPFERLLNVTAYELGDYKQFFQDPRTRAEYLQWAPLLLAAEEFKAKLPSMLCPDC